MKVKLYRIYSRDQHGYYGDDSVYLWPGEYDPDAMNYFGASEFPVSFYSTLLAGKKLEELREALPFYDSYGFDIREFEEEVDDYHFAGFIFPNGDFVYVPYMEHDWYIREAYDMLKEDFMRKHHCIEITNTFLNKGQKTILQPYIRETHTFMHMTEAQIKKLLDMYLPLDDMSKRQLRYEQEGLV